MRKNYKKILYLIILIIPIFVSTNVYAEEYFNDDNTYAIKITDVYLYSEASKNGKNTDIKETISWKANPNFETQQGKEFMENITLIDIKPNLELNNDEIKKIALENKKSDNTFEGYIIIDYSYKLPQNINSAFKFNMENTLALGFLGAMLSYTSIDDINDSDLSKLPTIPKCTINNNYTDKIEGKLLQVRLDENGNLTIDSKAIYKSSEEFIPNSDDSDVIVDGSGEINTITTIGLSETMYLSSQTLENLSYKKIYSDEGTLIMMSESDEDNDNNIESNNKNYDIYTFDKPGTFSSSTFKNILSDGIIINIKNNDNLLYSWTFDKSDITNANIELNTEILINSSDNKDKIEKIYKGIKATYLSFSHEGNFPGKANIKIRVSDYYKDNNELYLYYFNENSNKLELIQKNIKVENGYINITLEHASDYLLTLDEINVDATNETIKNPQTSISYPLLSIFIFLILGITLIIYTKKHNKFPNL